MGKPDENGAVASEYGLLILLIVLIIIAGIRILGLDIAGMYDSVLDAF